MSAATQTTHLVTPPITISFPHLSDDATGSSSNRCAIHADYRANDASNVPAATYGEAAGASAALWSTLADQLATQPETPLFTRADADWIIRRASPHRYNAAFELAAQLDSIPETEDYEDLLTEFAEQLDLSVHGFAEDFRRGVEAASQHAYETNGGGRGRTWDDPYYMDRRTERAMEDAEREFVDAWLRGWSGVMVGEVVSRVAHMETV